MIIFIIAIILIFILITFNKRIKDLIRFIGVINTYMCVFFCHTSSCIQKNFTNPHSCTKVPIQ